MTGHVVVLAGLGHSTTGGGRFFPLFVLIAIILYFIPTIVAVARSVPNTGSVIVINLLLGWTFIGWVVALAMAVRNRR